MTRTRAILITAAAGLSLGAAAHAGPLNPPAGGVAPTFKPLSQVEPRTPIGPGTTPGDSDSVYRIDAPGTYYLTGDLLGAAGKHGLEIAASDVTIDLNGFTLTGVTDSLDGIGVQGPDLAAIVVRNGSVRGWGGAGVEMTLASGGTVERVRAVGCGVGISGGQDGTVADCIAIHNLIGIEVGAGSAVARVMASHNEGNGVSLGRGATATDCVASFNNVGFYLGDGATAHSCIGYDNQFRGLFVEADGLVDRCTAMHNDDHGIELSSGSTARECLATASESTGLVIAGTCTVEGNLLVQQGTGLTATGSHNRIENNHTAQCGFGLRIAGSGNIIARNFAQGHQFADFQVAAGSLTGEVLIGPGPITVHNAWVNFGF